MYDGRTASKCMHVCLVINLNQQLQCDNFFQFTKFLIRISKNIFYFIRIHKFKGIGNCLSQFQHYNPNYKKLTKK